MGGQGKRVRKSQSPPAVIRTSFSAAFVRITLEYRARAADVVRPDATVVAWDPLLISRASPRLELRTRRHARRGAGQCHRRSPSSSEARELSHRLQIRSTTRA